MYETSFVLESKMSDLDDLNKTLYDIGAADLLDVWDDMESFSHRSHDWPSLLDSGSTPVLKDRLLTDSVYNSESSGCSSTGDFPVSNEHSYSLGAGSDGDSMPGSPFSLEDDMETECYPCISLESASETNENLGGETITIKKELREEDDVNVVDDEESKNSGAHQRAIKVEPLSNVQQQQHHMVKLSRPISKHPNSLLKRQPVQMRTIVLSNPPRCNISNNNNSNLLNSGKHSIKSSENCRTSSRTPITTNLISNQPKDGTGLLLLTEEEKRTLISEGYPIPSRLPLSKSEEKSLKKIRRKIKNKISAQESRRKKKEFVDTLERKVEVTAQELGDYKKRCDRLTKENTVLISQVKNLKAMMAVVTSQQQVNTVHNHQSINESQVHERDLELNIKIEPELLQNGFELD